MLVMLVPGGGKRERGGGKTGGKEGEAGKKEGGGKSGRKGRKLERFPCYFVVKYECK